MIEAISRRQLLLTGAALLIPGCREEETPLSTPSPEPHPTPTILAATNTPTPNFALTRVAILEAQAALNAAELSQARAALETRQAQPTNTPVPPTATLRSTATPLPPTATRVPPTATRTLPTSTPTPDENARLELQAKTHALKIWTDQLSNEYGPEPSEMMKTTYQTSLYYTNFERHFQSEGKGDDPARNQYLSKVLEGHLSPEQNLIQCSWKSVWRVNYTNMGDIYKAVFGEAEIRNLKAGTSGRSNLSEADKANGIRWRGDVKLDFLYRARAVITQSERGVTTIRPLNLKFSPWDSESKSIKVEVGANYIKDSYLDPREGYRIPLDIMVRLGRQSFSYQPLDCGRDQCPYPKQ